ncbi:MAG TPA: HAD family acid phosphatase [Stellaceae bacterium]|nr:HAD family acid phosphatase [Stellaceae bacterium]
MATVVLLLSAGSPAFAQTPAGCAAPLPPTAWAAQAPAGSLARLKQQLIRYRCTRYDADIAVVDHQAAAWIARRARHVMRPALVLDIDETSLSNWPVMVHNDFAYFRDGDCDLNAPRACGQAAWEKSAAAPAIAPTLALFNAARAEGVAVFFVTGRRETAEESKATETNLRSAGYDGWAGIFLRPPASHETSVSVFKASARAQIEAQGYHIIANVGDQQSDVSGGHAERSFKLPNPFYYVP